MPEISDWTNATAASGLGLTPNPFEGVVTFSWNRGVDGANNAISEYHIYYRVNLGTETGVNAGNSSSFALDLTSLSRGAVLDFRVAAIAPHNTAWSGYSAGARRNSAPYAPTSQSVARASYVPGESIPVSFAGNGDYDNNLTGYEVATNQDESIVGSGSISPVGVNTTGWERGIKRRFRVRAVDAFGARSSWSNYTAEITMNVAPNSPAVNYPSFGSTLYNPRPRILLTAGNTNDGPKHILCLSDDTEKTTASNGSFFSCGTKDVLASGQKVVYKRQSDYTVGSKSVSARMYDSYLYSESGTMPFTVAALSFTDPNLSTAGMKIKAVHITQLRTAINTLRDAYGFSAGTYTAMTAGVTKIGNSAIITELQTAIQAVIDRINGWDTSSSSFDISVNWISPAASGGGVDRVKLRQAIEQLRAILPTI